MIATPTISPSTTIIATLAMVLSTTTTTCLTMTTKEALTITTTLLTNRPTRVVVRIAVIAATRLASP